MLFTSKLLGIKPKRSGKYPSLEKARLSTWTSHSSWFVWINLWYDMIWYDMIWDEMRWDEMIWYDMVWYGMYACMYVCMYASIQACMFLHVFMYTWILQDLCILYTCGCMYVRAPLKCHTAPTKAKLLSFNKNGNLETLEKSLLNNPLTSPKTLASTRSHTQNLGEPPRTTPKSWMGIKLPSQFP